MQTQWFLSGEYTPAKELREIAEGYIGQAAWHIPLQSVADELKRHGFVISSNRSNSQG